jgi:hypothetical protein
MSLLYRTTKPAGLLWVTTFLINHHGDLRDPLRGQSLRLRQSEDVNGAGVVASMAHFDDFLHFALDVEIGLPLLLVAPNPISFFSKLRLIFSSMENMPSSELARRGTN